MLECQILQQLRHDLRNAKNPRERVIILSKMTNHKVDCQICSGKYQIAGAQQVRDEAFAGSWGNDK